MIMAARDVAGLSWERFDEQCLAIVGQMAAGIIEQMAGAKIKLKANYAGQAGQDVVTTVDEAAQRLFVRQVSQRLPKGVGWIGEENNLRKPSTLPVPIVLTADPLDGTRRFIEALEAGRKLVPGEVSSMIGVLVAGRAVGGYICDVASGVTYARRPYGRQTLRIGRDGKAINMTAIPGKSRTLAAGTLLKHGRREVVNPLTRRLMNRAFGNIVPGASSIGLSAARVMTGELAAMLRTAGGFTTPWDDAPIMALCAQGDLMALRVERDRLVRIRKLPLLEVTLRDFDVLYIRRTHVYELGRHVQVIG